MMTLRRAVESQERGRRAIARCGAALLVAALSILAAVRAHADPTLYHGLGFTASLPASIAVKKSELVDFDTYEFQREGDGRVLLGAYAGNAPAFPQSIPSDANEGIKRIHGLRATSYRWTDTAGRFHAQLLIELAPASEPRFPQFLHYWYHDLSGPDAALADGIVESTIGVPQ